MLLLNTWNFEMQRGLVSDSRDLVSYDIGLGGDVGNPEMNRVVHHDSGLEPAKGAAARRVFRPFHSPRFGSSVVTIIENVRVGVLRKQG